MFQSFDEATDLSSLAAKLAARLDCMGVLVTRVYREDQVILANSGVDLPPDLRLRMPLSYSICKHVSAMNFQLVIDDTNNHPLLRGNLAVDRLQVAAYLGNPIMLATNKAIGAICAIEQSKRLWTPENIEDIAAAGLVANRLLLRSV